ncbi:hypothetical protein [Nonomuraea africana]|uniref:hypothetical protein n=1 Tax=Nonomuraea africana TaxID=46171 RepID=UPI0034012DA8
MAWLSRWRRSAAFWRVLTLVLAGLPQLLNAPFPDLPDLGAERTDVDLTIATVSTGIVVRHHSPLEQWLEFILESGLVVLLPAAVFALPRAYGRQVAPWVSGGLVLLGSVIGYIGISALEDGGIAGLAYLLFLSPFYVLAGAALFKSERLALRQSDEPV